MSENEYHFTGLVGSLSEEELEDILDDIESEKMENDIRKAYQKHL